MVTYRKILMICVCVLSSVGCASVGELEVLNDIGLGQFRSTVKTFHRTTDVLGFERNGRRDRAAIANRSYGHGKRMRVDPNSVRDVPYIVRDINEIHIYTQKLTE